jgi:alkanesulfonate monooxygenase SsuD/methylene tetrahydromethanopterin reductase-like flavin-dependent oxidoreductase (luciferase family)
VSRRLLAGERVTHDGTFEVRDAGLEYELPEVPIYVAAQGPHMLRMAGKYADGVLYNGSHRRDVEWAADRVSEGLAERPTDPGAFDFAVYASVSVAASAEDARAAARPPVAFIAGGADDLELVARARGHAGQEQLPDAGADAVPVRFLDEPLEPVRYVVCNGEGAANVGGGIEQGGIRNLPEEAAPDCPHLGVGKPTRVKRRQYRSRSEPILAHRP